MGNVLRGLPVLVEAGEDSRPIAFWWRNRRYGISEYYSLWDDDSDSTAHWLVQTEAGRPVSLIYDRASSQWLMEWVDL